VLLHIEVEDVKGEEESSADLVLGNKVYSSVELLYDLLTDAQA